jgi:hypothetical protein
MNDRLAAQWEDDVLPVLSDYIRIPAVSVSFDPDWEASGHLDAAVELIRSWAAARPIAGLAVEVVRLPGRTPVIFMEIPASDGSADAGADTVLLYVNLDKRDEDYGSALDAYVDYYVGDGGYEAVAEVGYVQLTEEAWAEVQAAWEAKESNVG